MSLNTTTLPRTHALFSSTPSGSQSEPVILRLRRAIVFQPAIEQAIDATLPRGPGTRNRQLFEFARKLKAIAGLADAKVDDLQPLVAEWHRRALPKITTKEFAESWYDFANSWKSVRFASGSETFVRQGQQFAKWRDAKGKTRTAKLTTGRDGSPRIFAEDRTS